MPCDTGRKGMSDHSPGPNEVRMKDGTIAPRVLWEDLGVRRRKWAELRKLTVQRNTLLAALKVVTRSQRELAIFADSYGQLDEEHVQAWTQAQAAIDTVEGE